MTMRYFKLSDDVEVPGRWELGAPLDGQGQKIWTWLFRRGEPVALEGEIQIPLSRAGKPLDFSVAGAAVPIIHEKAAAIFSRLAANDVQLMPVTVESQAEAYFALNALRRVRCIDDAACEEVQYWSPEDGQPELVGEYRVVAGLRIDPMKVGDAKVFRPWGWPVVLVVAEDVKEALERAGVTGVKFKEVTGPSAISPEERERNRKLLELRKQTDTAREAFWRTLGKLDDEVLVPIAVGGSWPARRQVCRVIHRLGGRTLLVTDGLSDFFVDQAEPSMGFGLELALETDESLEDAEKSWPLVLLERVADEVAKHERVRERLKAGLISMEVSGRDMPETLVTYEGRVGVLLGMQSSLLPQNFAMPTGEVRLITVKTLLPRELVYLLKNGKRGGEELVHLFVDSGAAYLSRASRKPVV